MVREGKSRRGRLISRSLSNFVIEVPDGPFFRPLPSPPLHTPPASRPPLSRSVVPVPRSPIPLRPPFSDHPPVPILGREVPEGTKDEIKDGGPSTGTVHETSEGPPEAPRAQEGPPPVLTPYPSRCRHFIYGRHDPARPWGPEYRTRGVVSPKRLHSIPETLSYRTKQEH